MRIAIFSDIHANLPALESFFASCEKQNPDMVMCLGDLVGYNVWPNEVIREIRERRIPTIAGNYDFGIGRSSTECGCAYKTTVEKENGSRSIAYTNEVVQSSERAYLRSLPLHIRLQFQTESAPLSLLFVHGSPRRINEYLFEDRNEESLHRMMRDADADIMCFGHTHKPFHRVIPDQGSGEMSFRHAINVGSVGKPKNGSPQGTYVIVSIDDASTVFKSESIGVEFIRFDYDVEKAAQAIENSPLPDEYAHMLRSGL